MGATFAGRVVQRLPKPQRSAGARTRLTRTSTHCSDKVNPHTDSLLGIEVEQGKNTPVIGMSLGASMIFWVNKMLGAPSKLGRARAAAVLKEGRRGVVLTLSVVNGVISV